MEHDRPVRPVGRLLQRAELPFTPPQFLSRAHSEGEGVLPPQLCGLCQGGARPRRGGYPGRRGARARWGRLDGRGGGPLPGPAPDRAPRAAGGGTTDSSATCWPRRGSTGPRRCWRSSPARRCSRAPSSGSRSAACGGSTWVTRSPGRRLHSGRCSTSTRSLGLPLYDRAASVTAELRRSGDRPGLGLDVCGSPGVFTLVPRRALRGAQAFRGGGGWAVACAAGHRPGDGLVLTPVNGLYLTPIMDGAAVGRSCGRSSNWKLLVILGVAGVAVALFRQPDPGAALLGGPSSVGAVRPTSCVTSGSACSSWPGSARRCSSGSTR